MFYCRLCSYKSDSRRCVTLHLQAVHHFGARKSLQFVSDLNPTVVQPMERSTSSLLGGSGAILAEIRALQSILKEAEDIMAARRNPAHCANRHPVPKCIGCLAYRCEIDSMEKIVKEMELIEKLKTIDEDGNTPLPCTVGTAEQLSQLQKLRSSCLQLLLSQVIDVSKALPYTCCKWCGKAYHWGCRKTESRELRFVEIASDNTGRCGQVHCGESAKKEKSKSKPNGQAHVIANGNYTNAGQRPLSRVSKCD